MAKKRAGGHVKLIFQKSDPKWETLHKIRLGIMIIYGFSPYIHTIQQAIIDIIWKII